MTYRHHAEKGAAEVEFEMIQKMIAEVLGIDPSEVTKEASFVDDLGADSMDRLRLILRLEDEFRIELGGENSNEVQTVADLIRQIEQMKP